MHWKVSTSCIYFLCNLPSTSSALFSSIDCRGPKGELKRLPLGQREKGIDSSTDGVKGGYPLSPARGAPRTGGALWGVSSPSDAELKYIRRGTPPRHPIVPAPTSGLRTKGVEGLNVIKGWPRARGGESEIRGVQALISFPLLSSRRCALSVGYPQPHRPSSERHDTLSEPRRPL